jgi:hypothetical protein
MVENVVIAGNGEVYFAMERRVEVEFHLQLKVEMKFSKLAGCILYGYSEMLARLNF